MVSLAIRSYRFQVIFDSANRFEVHCTDLKDMVYWLAAVLILGFDSVKCLPSVLPSFPSRLTVWLVFVRILQLP